MRITTLILLITIFVTGCSGRDSNKIEDVLGENPYDNYKSGNCGLNIVTNYNDMVIDCGFGSQVNKCEQSVALKSSLSSVEEEYFYITQNNLSKMLKKLE